MPQDENVTPLKKDEELQFDGERFVPGSGVEITYHHWLRYFFARQFAADKRVLDVASGEGYGAVYLSATAKKVDAFDVSADAVAHARIKYADNPRLSFTRSDIEGFFRDAQPGSYDLVTAYEVIEHVDEPVQIALLEGIRRVLAPGGVALISTPDKQLYSDMKLMKNPFHVREMYRDEFGELIGKVFQNVRMYDQFAYTGSAITDPGASRGELCEMAWTDLLRLKGKVQPGVRAGGEYLIALVSNDPLPEAGESAVMLDRSRKLVGEEVYAKQVEVDRLQRTEAELRAVVADLRKQIDEIKQVWVEPEEAIMMRATIDRLLGVIARNETEMAAQNGPVATQLRSDANHFRFLYEKQRQDYEALRSLVSVQLVMKAKRAWDRVPFVKNIAKAVVKKLV